VVCQSLSALCVLSGLVSYTSQWDYTALHARTSFTTCTAADRLRVWSRWRWVAGQRVPAGDGRSVGPSWDLDKQPFVFVDAFVSQCGDLPTASTWTDGLTDRCYFLLIYSQRRRADSYHFYAPFILPGVVNRNEEKQS